MMLVRHIYAPDGAIIAVVHNQDSKVSDYPLEATRDLMAAAPDMLEAIQTVVHNLRFCPDKQERAIKASASAISKATGAARSLI